MALLEAFDFLTRVLLGGRCSAGAERRVTLGQKASQRASKKAMKETAGKKETRGKK